MTKAAKLAKRNKHLQLLYGLNKVFDIAKEGEPIHPEIEALLKKLGQITIKHCEE